MLDLGLTKESMENKSIDLEKIIGMVMNNLDIMIVSLNKLDTIDASLERLTNGFKKMKKCMREELYLSLPSLSSMKETVEWEVIKEENNKIEA